MDFRGGCNPVPKIIATISLLAGLFLSACESTGPQTNPFVREAQWFSYMNGDDLRAKCRPDAASRYRLIYNGQYLHQVRSYDIVQDVGADFAVQETHVFSRGLGGVMSYDNGEFDFDADQSSREEINYDHLLAIDQALISAGFENPAPEDLFLHSDDFYWVAMVCRGGVFKFQAWSEQNTAISLLPFEQVLGPGDGTDILFRSADTPKYPGRGSRHLAGTEDGDYSYFAVQVGKNGLRR